MAARQSIRILRALLAPAWLGAGFAAIYFLVRGSLFLSRVNFPVAPSTGLVFGLCGALAVSIAAAYVANLPHLRRRLEDEVLAHVATARELRERKVKALKAIEAKADYLAKMSHELRTPINAVIGYSEMLIEDMVAAGRESADIGKILQTGKHLLSLINDVLDHSKIDARKMEIFPEQASLGSLIGQITASCTALAAENANRFSSALLGEDQAIVIDKRKFQQVVAKLVATASHLVREGEIRLDGAQQGGAIEITVRVLDGTIIGAHAAPILSDFRAGTAGLDSSHDSSLGLALAEKLCRLMGGAFWIAGEAGQDLRLSMRLPANFAGPAPQFAQSDGPRAGAGSRMAVALHKYLPRLFPVRDGAMLSS